MLVILTILVFCVFLFEQMNSSGVLLFAPAQLNPNLSNEVRLY